MPLWLCMQIPVQSMKGAPKKWEPRDGLKYCIEFACSEFTKIYIKYLKSCVVIK